MRNHEKAVMWRGPLSACMLGDAQRLEGYLRCSDTHAVDESAKGSAAELKMPTSVLIAEFVEKHGVVLPHQATRRIRAELCLGVSRDGGVRSCLANLDATYSTFSRATND